MIRTIKFFILMTILLGSLAGAFVTQAGPAFAAPAFAVGPQYATTHVYVAPEDFDHFVASIVATFGGTKSKRVMFQATPTPSRTISQLVLTPVGNFSVFGFETPVPYPFGIEQSGYLVTDLEAALAAAKSHGADVTVTIFQDPIGRDAIVEWPGGVHMQFYWHWSAPSLAALQTVPESHVYVSPAHVEAFVTAFNEFSQGKVASDERQAPGAEIGRPADTYRRVRIDSQFGKLTVIATDGQLPFPYGREMAGYEVADIGETIDKAKAAGATVLVPPYIADKRKIAIVQFPGGYIADIHSLIGK
jgi:predicted enzyme related to lactoylglutathione lyase